MIITSIKTAKEMLDKGNVVAIPTETVYGLAGNAFSKVAIEKIYALKKRPLYNPLIVHIGDLNQLADVAKNIPENAYKLAKVFWPGPLTLLLEKQDNIPDIVTAGMSTVAVRVPNHKTTRSLLSQLDYPLAAPSANPFGSISPTSSAHVYEYFKSHETYILEGGECKDGIESTIIGFDSAFRPILYRHGAISVSRIEAVIGNLLKVTTSNKQPPAPGMLNKHYAPTTKIITSKNILESVNRFKNLKIGLILFKESDLKWEVVAREILSKKGDFNEASRNFYAALHRLDKIGLDIIIAEEMPMFDLGLTLNDRLNRATK